MIWVRKTVVYLLSVLLLLVLLGTALAISVNVALAHPAKLETWLSQSNVYGHFISTVISQAQKSTGSDDGSSGVSLSDSAVEAAAEAAFPPTLLQQDVNTFLNSNYAWLEGKSSTPNFVIDLSGAKQNFAQQVGQAVQTYLTNIPVCTAAQAAALQTNDPLSLPCRPSDLSPTAAAASAEQSLAQSTGFLDNPIITASSISPNAGNSQSQPYYQKLSFAPRAYRLATKSPLLLGGLAVLSAVGIVFIAPRKRKGLRRVGIVCAEAGIILIAAAFLANAVFKKLEDKIFNSASIGQLQQALTDFAHRVESQISHINLYCGIVLVVVAIIIFIVLLATRSRSPKRPAVVSPDEASTPETPVHDTAGTQPTRTGKAVTDVTVPAGSAKPAATPDGPNRPQPPKRPRLIQ